VSSDHINDLKNLCTDLDNELIKAFKEIESLQKNIADEQTQIITLFQKVSIVNAEKERVHRIYNIRYNQWDSEE
jgi:hypothetical protein